MRGAARITLWALAIAVVAAAGLSVGDDQVKPDAQPPQSEAVRRLLAGEFKWTTGAPVVSRHGDGDGQTYYSIKDPSIVRHDGRWHLFCTVRGKPRSHQVEYLSFADWPDAAKAERRFLDSASTGYYCAPQVFYFRPQKKWYMICQASDEAWQPKYGAAYATCGDLGKPDSWSKLKPLGARPADGKAGLDYWVICDEQRAYLFFTTLDGRMWREQTSLEAFPGGWSEAELALRGDIFEASHTYKLKGLARYLTVVEAQGDGGRRYYKAYLADRLDGPWTPVAATREKCFAGADNVTQDEPRWTDSISHVELIRTGSDERLEVDPENLQVLFQGVSDKDRGGKPYGEIPWRLGLLRPVR
ncbi:MAG: glycoside hydrolase [Planctomycetes bacterium]|nr:glycoside hydrolase [Planctomycetota bacterium]